MSSPLKHPPVVVNRYLRLACAHPMLSKRLSFLQLESGHAFQKSTLILVTLGAASVNALIAAISIPLAQITQLAAIAVSIYLFLAVLVWRWGLVDFAAHALVGSTFCIFATLISQTGGINSPAVVWMLVLAIATVPVIDLRWAMLWMGLIVIHNALQFVAVQRHWIDGRVNEAVFPPAAAFWVRINVLVFIAMALSLYEAIFRRRMQTLTSRNADLAALQNARSEAQRHIDALIVSLSEHLSAPVQKIATLQSQLRISPAQKSTPSPSQIKVVALQVIELLNQFLDIARFETGRLQLQQAPFDVRRAVSQVLTQACVPMAMSKGQALWVQGDRSRFVQVLSHVLNQVLQERDGRYLQVQPTLHGTMIEVALLLIPNQLGADVAPALSLQGSSGDTLLVSESNQDWADALCHRLMKMAGAQLRKADGGQGITHIVLNWPTQVCEVPPPEAPAPPDVRLQNWQILLVDDQPERLTQLQTALRRDWPAATLGLSAGGESALLQLEFAHYDLVLIALHMQPVDGLETVRQIRQHTKAQVRNVPVIGLGDKEFAHQRHRCKDAGMQWLVFRPLDAQQLSQIIEIHLPHKVQ